MSPARAARSTERGPCRSCSPPTHTPFFLALSTPAAPSPPSVHAGGPAGGTLVLGPSLGAAEGAASQLGAIPRLLPAPCSCESRGATAPCGGGGAVPCRIGPLGSELGIRRRCPRAAAVWVERGFRSPRAEPGPGPGHRHEPAPRRAGEGNFGQHRGHVGLWEGDDFPRGLGPGTDRGELWQGRAEGAASLLSAPNSPKGSAGPDRCGTRGRGCPSGGHLEDCLT